MSDRMDGEREERWAVLRQLEEWIEWPMLVLGFVWLGLLVLELTRGLSPPLEALGTVIWVIFILEFALRLLLAPDRVGYLRRSWLTAVSLLVPALRVFRAARALRVLRLARVGRGARLVKVVASVNRGMRALGRSFARRGFGYVTALTALVVLAGAAGMLAFERDAPGSAITDYGGALWWTAMVVTTMGSDYFPRTAEGRALCLLLALFAFAVFGYVTATLATFFIGRDAAAATAGDADDRDGVASKAAVDALRSEIAALRAEIRGLRGGATAGPTQ